jgi:hypothetical protein
MRTQLTLELVELAGIEPASSSVEPGLLRVQSVMAFSQPRRSHRQVADRLSQEKVPITPPDGSDQQVL